MRLTTKAGHTMLPFEMERTRMDLSTVKETLSSFLRGREEILFAYLFGSVVGQSLTPLSDIDVAVLIDPAKIREEAYPYGYPAALTGQLMSCLKTNGVDLVILNEAPPSLRHRVLTRGQRIFSRDPRIERGYFVRTLHDYFDTALLRRIQWDDLRRRLQALGPTQTHG